MSQQSTAQSLAAAESRDTSTHDEEQPLLICGGRRKGWKGGLRRNAVAEIDRDRADLILILCYFVTGLLDSASISIWSSFVSMQTGNTIYLGLGLAAPHESNRWKKSLTSLAFFCFGSVCFSRYHQYFSPKRRWVLVASFTLQFFFITASAALLNFGPLAAENEITWNVIVPIALVAFQSAGQAVASRALKYNALTSVVLTSIYCDLFSDADILKANNVERNRRAAAPIMLLVGAIVGGVFAHTNFGIAGALWLAAGLKLVTVIAWILWPEEKKGSSL